MYNYIYLFVDCPSGFNLDVLFKEQERLLHQPQLVSAQPVPPSSGMFQHISTEGSAQLMTPSSPCILDNTQTLPPKVIPLSPAKTQLPKIQGIKRLHTASSTAQPADHSTVADHSVADNSAAQQADNSAAQLADHSRPQLMDHTTAHLADHSTATEKKTQNRKLTPSAAIPPQVGHVMQPQTAHMYPPPQATQTIRPPTQHVTQQQTGRSLSYQAVRPIPHNSGHMIPHQVGRSISQAPPHMTRFAHQPPPSTANVRDVNPFSGSFNTDYMLESWEQDKAAALAAKEKRLAEEEEQRQKPSEDVADYLAPVQDMNVSYDLWELGELRMLVRSRLHGVVRNRKTVRAEKSTLLLCTSKQ